MMTEGLEKIKDVLRLRYNIPKAVISAAMHKTECAEDAHVQDWLSQQGQYYSLCIIIANLSTTHTAWDDRCGYVFMWRSLGM